MVLQILVVLFTNIKVVTAVKHVNNNFSDFETEIMANPGGKFGDLSHIHLLVSVANVETQLRHLSISQPTIN